MKTSQLKTVKEKLGHRFDTYSIKNGVITVRRGFFYTHGCTDQDCVDQVLEKFPDAHIVESGEIWKSFLGGASIAAQSHWYVKFTL